MNSEELDDVLKLLAANQRDLASTLDYVLRIVGIVGRETMLGSSTFEQMDAAAQQAVKRVLNNFEHPSALTRL